MKPSYTEWSNERRQSGDKCRHVTSMSCIPLQDDRMCRACYQEDMQRQGYARPYMYGRFNSKSSMPSVLHMVQTTGRTLCGRHGHFMSYMVRPDGPVCLVCLDEHKGVKQLRKRGYTLAERRESMQ